MGFYKILGGNKMSNVKVTKEQVENFIESYDISTIKDKTTVVVATLKNGFVIVESSSCVDPANYDEKIGADICKEKIEDQVWHLLGFNLQQKQYEQTPAMPCEEVTGIVSIDKKDRQEQMQEVMKHYYPKAILSHNLNEYFGFERNLEELTDKEFKSFMISFYTDRLDEKTEESNKIIRKMKKL